jgi:hypothetical protein
VPTRHCLEHPVSSTYSAICLSHDPGIVLGPDLTYAEANSLNSRDRLAGHETCDLVIGRYSYPLIEAACLGTQLPGPSGCNVHHSNVAWIDRDWLRLLAAAVPLPAIGKDLLQPLLRCWTPERLHRLRDELGTPKPTPTPAAPVEQPATRIVTTIPLTGPVRWVSAIPTAAAGDCPSGLISLAGHQAIRPCVIKGPHVEHQAADSTRWTSREDFDDVTDAPFLDSRPATPDPEAQEGAVIVNRILGWLSKRGLVSVNNSICGGMRSDIRVNVQGRWWVPEWIVVAVGRRYFLRTHPSSASSLRLSRVDAHLPAADGTRRWTLTYRPTRPA